MRWLLGAFFVLAGVNHFLRTDFYLRMMPPYVPWHLELVWISGVCEMALGAAVLIPRYRIPAAWGLIALLIAVFPANVHMALNSSSFPAFSPAALYLRLPIQGVLIAWVWWSTRDSSSGMKTARRTSL